MTVKTLTYCIRSFKKAAQGLAVAILFILPALLLAQKNDTGVPEIDLSKVLLRAGVHANFPTIPSQRDTFTSRVGWGLTFSGEYKAKPRFSILVQAQMNQYGYRQHYSDSLSAGVDSSTNPPTKVFVTQSYERTVTERYLDLSINGMYRLADHPQAVALMAGLGGSFFLGRSLTQADIPGADGHKPTYTGRSIMFNVGVMVPVSRVLDVSFNYSGALGRTITPNEIKGRLDLMQLHVFFKINPPPRDSKAELKSPVEQQTETAAALKREDIVLVVRLKENKKKLEALNANGDAAGARELITKTENDNKEIREAFKNFYNTTPVFFFFDTDSKRAVQQDFAGILLNKEQQRDTAIKLPEGRMVLFAEFGQAFDEATQTSGLTGFVVYDSSFKQMPEPFPSFQGDAYGLLKKEEVVSRYNKKLRAFFGVPEKNK